MFPVLLYDLIERLFSELGIAFNSGFATTTDLKAKTALLSF
jgi:hypothetical protein